MSKKPVEDLIDTDEFVALLKKKQRKIKYTSHSQEGANNRNLADDKTRIDEIFETDLKEHNPYKVFEQTCETPGERKFKLYFMSSSGGFMCYVIVLNDELRLITVYRTTKNLQEKIYKRLRERGYK